MFTFPFFLQDQRQVIARSPKNSPLLSYCRHQCALEFDHLNVKKRLKPLLQLLHAEVFLRRRIKQVIRGLGRNEYLRKGLDYAVVRDSIDFGNFVLGINDEQDCHAVVESINAQKFAIEKGGELDLKLRLISTDYAQGLISRGLCTDMVNIFIFGERLSNSGGIIEKVRV